MQIVNMFPVSVFVFENTHIDNLQLIHAIQADPATPVKSTSNHSYTRNLHDQLEFADLFAWIGTCLDQVKAQHDYDCDTISITSSWANLSRANSGQRQNYHRHSMSWYSGVYYLTEGVPTLFEDPVQHRTQAQIEVLRKNWPGPFEHIDMKPGRLVIFPSWMYHATPPHIGPLDRWIISFNTLPSGRVNYSSATDSVADITINTQEKKPW
jgi:uncharacterized protein (TIGR02466 family)